MNATSGLRSLIGHCGHGLVDTRCLHVCDCFVYSSRALHICNCFVYSSSVDCSYRFVDNWTSDICHCGDGCWLNNWRDVRWLYCRDSFVDSRCLNICNCFIYATWSSNICDCFVNAASVDSGDLSYWSRAIDNIDTNYWTRWSHYVNSDHRLRLMNMVNCLDRCRLVNMVNSVNMRWLMVMVHLLNWWHDDVLMSGHAPMSMRSLVDSRRNHCLLFPIVVIVIKWLLAGFSHFYFQL